MAREITCDVCGARYTEAKHRSERGDEVIVREQKLRLFIYAESADDTGYNPLDVCQQCKRFAVASWLDTVK